MADYSSLSSHGVRSPRICRGAVERRRWTTGSFLWGPAPALRGCANSDGTDWAHARPWSTAAHPECSKNYSVLHSARSRSDRAVSVGSTRALHNRAEAAVPIRSPPHQALRRRRSCGRGRLKTSRSCGIAPGFITPVHESADNSMRRASQRAHPRGLGCEEPQEPAPSGRPFRSHR